MARFEVIITATDAGFTTTMKAAQMQMNLTAAKVQLMNSAMAGMKQYAMLGAGSLAAMVLPTVMASKAVGDFDSTLRRIIAIGGPSFIGMNQQLTDSIMDVSKKYGVAYEDIAEGILQFVKAGYEYDEIINDMLIPTTQLAIVNQTDFKTASELAVISWTIFGESLKKEGKDINNMMEEMFQAANISLLEFEDFGNIMEYAGSAASVASVPFEELLALFAALSQVGYKSGQNVRTLMQRLMVPDENMMKLDALLGEGGIIEAGTVNIDKLMDVFAKTETLSPEVLKAMVDAMGVRSTGALLASYKAGDSFLGMLNRIKDSEGNLAKAGDEMALSITSAWQKIRTAFMQPITDQKVMEGMSKALNSLAESISSGPLGKALQDILMTSINFIVTQGPSLIETISQLAKSFMSMLPTLQSMATSFSGFLEWISKLNPAILQFVMALYLTNRVIPFSVFQTKAMAQALATVSLRYQESAVASKTATVATETNIATTKTATVATAAYGNVISINSLKLVGMSAALNMVAFGGMAAVTLGMMAFIGAKDNWTRAAAGIVMAAGMMAAMFFQLAVAQAAMANAPIPIVGWIALGITVAAIAGAAILAAKVAKEQQASARAMANEANSFATGGRVISSGKGLVHEGEIIVSEDEMAEVSRNYQVPMQYAHSVGGSVNVEGMGYVHKDEAIVSLEEEPVRDIKTREIKKRKPKLGKAKYIAEEGWTYLESKEVIIPKNKVQQLGDVLGFWSPKQQTSILNNINIPTTEAPKIAVSGPRTASIKLVTFPVLNSLVSQKTLKEVKKEKKEFGKQTILDSIRDRLTERTAIKEREKESSKKSLIERLTSKSERLNVLSSAESLESSTTEYDITNYQKSSTEKDISSIISKEFYDTMSEKERSQRESVSIYQDREQDTVSKYVKDLNAVSRFETEESYIKRLSELYNIKDFVSSAKELSKSKVSEEEIEKKYQHATGGEVQKEGWGYLHEKEYIVSPQDMASVQNQIIETRMLPILNTSEIITKQNTNNVKIISQAIKRNDSVLKETNKILKSNALMVSSTKNAITEIINEPIKEPVKASTSAIRPTPANKVAQKETQKTKDWLGELLTSGDWITKFWKAIGINLTAGLPQKYDAEKAAKERAIEDTRWASGVNRTWLPTVPEGGLAPSVEPVSRTWQEMMSEKDKTYTAAWTEDREALKSATETYAQSEWMLMTTESGLARMELKANVPREQGGEKDYVRDGIHTPTPPDTTRPLPEELGIIERAKETIQTIKDNGETILAVVSPVLYSAWKFLDSFGKKTPIVVNTVTSAVTPSSFVSSPEYIPPETNLAAGGKGARELARVSHAAGGFVESAGWGYLHANERIVPDMSMAQVKMPEFPSYPKASAPIQSTVENSTTNYDNKIVNMYSIKEEDLQRILARNGRGK